MSGDWFRIHPVLDAEGAVTRFDIVPELSGEPIGHLAGVMIGAFAVDDDGFLVARIRLSQKARWRIGEAA